MANIKKGEQEGKEHNQLGAVYFIKYLLLRVLENKKYPKYEI